VIKCPDAGRSAMFRICSEFSVMFRICSEFSECSEFSAMFRICSEFSVMFIIFSEFLVIFRIFRHFSEYLAQKLVYSESLDFVVSIAVTPVSSNQSIKEFC
jgi:hypothetical protein